MQEGTSQILQPLMNKKCLWLHMGILFTRVTGSLFKLHQNWRAEKHSNNNKHELQQGSLLHKNCSIPFGDNLNQILIFEKLVRTYR